MECRKKKREEKERSEKKRKGREGKGRKKVVSEARKEEREEG